MGERNKLFRHIQAYETLPLRGSKDMRQKQTGRESQFKYFFQNKTETCQKVKKMQEIKKSKSRA